MNEKRMCLCGAVDLSQYDTPGVIVTGWGSHGLQACSSHSEGCWRWHNECAESLIEWQQAAIKRVRGIVDADQTVPIDARDPASYVAGYADATFRVRQVLDGQR